MHPHNIGTSHIAIPRITLFFCHMRSPTVASQRLHPSKKNRPHICNLGKTDFTYIYILPIFIFNLLHSKFITGCLVQVSMPLFSNSHFLNNNQSYSTNTCKMSENFKKIKIEHSSGHINELGALDLIH